jgi:CRP/FNR family transcriptional regulator
MKNTFPFPDDLLAVGRELKLAKGERLFSLGEAIDRVFYVQQGELRAVRCLADGSEAVMMRARDGEFFAIASLFLPSYPCDAEVGINTRLLSFPQPYFRAVLGRDPAFALALVREQSLGVKTQCARVERLRLKRARDRVVHYLACESREGLVRLAMPLIEWADELGMEPETLYRVLAELKDEQVIARRGKEIRLLTAPTASCAIALKT